MNSFYRKFNSIAFAVLNIFLAQNVAAQDLSDNENDEVDLIVNSILTVRDTDIESDSLMMQKEIMRLAKLGIELEDEPTDAGPAGDADNDFLKRWDEAVSKSESIVRNDNDGPKTLYRITDTPRVTTRRFYLKKGASKKFITNCRYTLSVAVVPERRGLVTMRMHAYNRHGYDQHFDDSEKFHQGKSYRKRILKLPKEVSKVEIEVINRSPKDISYILITK